jgi:hypothetical protein
LKELAKLIKKSEAVLRSYQYNQCAGPQKLSKLRFSKMLTKKNLAKNSNAVVKNKHNFGFKNLEFDFFAVVGQFKLKKRC